MAIDLLYWCGRHADGLFLACLVIVGLKFVGDVIVAIDQGVQKFKARTSKL